MHDENKIIAFIEGDLSSKDYNRMKQHILQCENCRKLYEKHLEIISQTKIYFDSVKPKNNIKVKAETAVVKYAAAIGLGAVLLIYVFNLMEPDNLPDKALLTVEKNNGETVIKIKNWDTEMENVNRDLRYINKNFSKIP